jgi:tetratricopeptide (TPR) repeat protein
MNNEILEKNTLSNALSPIRFNNGNLGTNGLGWFLGNLNGHNYITHDGLGWGYGAVVIYFPEEDLFIAHLRNCGYCQYNRDLSYQAPIKIASILLDSEFQDIHENKNNINYTGIYTSNRSEDKIIITQENHSYLKKGDNYIPLKYIKEHTFFSERTNETIVFSKNGLTSSIGTTIHFIKSKTEPKVPLNLFLLNNMKDILKEEIVSIGLEKVTNENYEANESAINNLGYSYIQKRNMDYAIEIFRLNTVLFPKSSNAFDSLAEAYYYKEHYDEALKNYTKSLELNPENYNAASMMEKIKTKNY